MLQPRQQQHATHVDVGVAVEKLLKFAECVTVNTISKWAIDILQELKNVRPELLSGDLGSLHRNECESIENGQSVWLGPSPVNDADDSSFQVVDQDISKVEISMRPSNLEIKTEK